VRCFDHYWESAEGMGRKLWGSAFMGLSPEAAIADGGDIMKGNDSTMKKAEKNGIAGFRILENECVWMKAGVVNFRLCENDYDCFHCSFDRAMRSAMDAQHPHREKQAASWPKRMQQKHLGASKFCPYFLSGQIGPPGICTRNFDCDDCPIELALGYNALKTKVEAERRAQETAINRAESSGIEKKEGREAAYSPTVGDECVWMKAGITNFRICDNDFDCYHCSFDQSMREAMATTSSTLPKATPLAWAARIDEQYAVVVKPCSHYLAGRSNAPKECTMNYECYRCPHHHIQEGQGKENLPGPPKYKVASGHRLAEGYHYHLGHSWVRIEGGGLVRAGIDAFCGNVFGPPDAVALPPEGTSLKKGQVGWVLFRDDHEAPVQSPVTGTVLAVNPRMEKDPRVCWEDPYHEGWLLLLEPAFLNFDLKGLYFSEECLQWMEKENQQLMGVLGPEYERLAATGAEAVDDVFGHVPGIDWDGLVRNFLRTTKTP
jgi:glycine cleavage system H lipoate-binding protein